MKKFTSFITAFLFSALLFAQAPQNISYQAVVRDAENDLLTSSTIGLQISILKGSTSGNSVFSENHQPTTNVNGLFSIQIGSGNNVAGDFSTIDWSDGPYFIKTEIDPLGANNYTIEGLTELISVPYALYAEKAGNTFSGDFNDLVNTPDLVSRQTFEDSIAVLRNLIQNLDQRIRQFELNIGDFKDGGVIGYIFEEGDAGYVAGETHGLIVALEEGEQAWTFGTFTNVVGTSADLGTGLNNSNLIISSAGGNNAAAYCRNFNGGDFNDWFLPSQSELNKIYQNRDAINTGLNQNQGAILQSSGFGYYWTSTQYDFNYGIRLEYSSGSFVLGSKSNNLAARPVRQF